jgi:bifunctional non-homologous end joining protein LigD
MPTKKSAITGKKAAKQKRATVPCASARKARMPTIIHPMLATLVDDPFSDPGWIFETKWDGFRSVCFVRHGQAQFFFAQSDRDDAAVSRAG